MPLPGSLPGVYFVYPHDHVAISLVAADGVREMITGEDFQSLRDGRGTAIPAIIAVPRGSATATAATEMVRTSITEL